MLRHLSVVSVCACVLLLSALARAADDKPFEMSALQRMTFAGQVSNPKIVNENARKDEKAKPTDIEFGVIPTRMMSAQTWLNPVTNAVEQRIYPAILHPIPVIRAAHVRVFDKAPDLSKLALDEIQKDESEAELDPAKPLMLVADEGARNVVLLSFSKIELPQDKVEQWKIAGTITPVTLAEHIADPIADRGRAVPTKTPLPLSGTLVFGQRRDMMQPTTFFSLDLAKPGQPKQIADKVTEGRVANNGTIADRVESRTLRMTDAKGSKLGEIVLESDIGDFAISANGRWVALSTERFVEDKPDQLPRRETVTLVYGVNGRKLSEIVGYDDPAFLPDGNLVVTGQSADSGLFITDLKAGKATRIEFKDAPKETSEGREPDWWPRNPVVSPDGKKIAFVSGREVYVIGIDGHGWTPVWIIETHEPQSSPVFSPDGKYIAMIVTPLNVMTGPGQVFVFDLQQRVRQAIEAAKAANSDVPLTWMP